MVNKIVSRNSKDFSDGLLSLKNRKKLCDTTLIVNNKRIPVHSNILASSCEYFLNELVNAKSPATEITFVDVNTEAFLLLIEYCYTGSIEISEKNAKEIAAIANLLILPSIIEGSCEILTKVLNSENCLLTWKFAKKEHLENLETSSIKFVEKNFEDVSQSQEFFNLEFSEIQQLLSLDINETQMLIYNAMKSWISHDNAVRAKYLNDLLNCLKLVCLPLNFLISESLQLCSSDFRCFKTFNEAYQKQTENNLENCRSSNTLMVVGAGELVRAKTLEVFDIMKQEWVEIANFKCNRMFFAASLLNDKLILSGGYSNNSAVNNVECFNLRSGKMETLAPMKHPRYKLSTVVFNECVYAIGGYSTTTLSVVEKWDPETKSWSDMASMNQPRYVCGAAVLKNEIFVAGGHVTSALDSVEAYNPFTNKWRKCKSLNHKRFAPGVAVIKGFMFIVGGSNENILNTTERYDSKYDNWTMIESMQIARKHLAAGYLMGKLVAAGGFLSSGLSLVETYDEEFKKWESMAPLKNIRYDFTLVEVPWSLCNFVLSNKILP